MAANDDELQLILTTRLKGAQEINAGVKAAQNFATAENKVADAFKSGVGPYERRIKLQKELNDAMAKGESTARLADIRLASQRNAAYIRRIERPTPPGGPDAFSFGKGPFGRRDFLQGKLSEAIERGGTSSQIADIKYAMAQNDAHIKRITTPEKPEATPGDRLAQAFFSTRFGGGTLGKMGIQPLVGRSLDAISPELKQGIGRFAKAFGDSAAGLEVEAGGAEVALGALAGAAVLPVAVFAAIVAGGIMVTKGLFDAAGAAAQLTQQFSDLQYRVGGSSSDAAAAMMMSRITGVDAGSASRSLRDRITSDPLSMGIAAQYGVRALPGIFGQRNFGAQYQQLVKALASNPNQDQAMRQADQLGIGQEVQRYRLISPDMQGRLADTANVSARINTPDNQARAAEFEAALQNVGGATDNLKTAFGSLFETDFTNMLNKIADGENWLAGRIQDFADYMQGKGWGGSRGAQGGASGGPGMGGAPGSIAEQQLAATNQMIAALKENSRFLAGNTPRDDEAIPGGLRGRNLANWHNNRLIHLGTLGAT